VPDAKPYGQPFREHGLAAAQRAGQSEDHTWFQNFGESRGEAAGLGFGARDYLNPVESPFRRRNGKYPRHFTFNGVKHYELILTGG